MNSPKSSPFPADLLLDDSKLESSFVVVPIKKTRCRFPKKRLLSTVIVLAFLGLFAYRPLPEGLTACGPDRFAMHLIEPVLRVTYLYPADRLCPDAFCRLRWTRAVLNVLSRVIDPRNMFDYHPTLHLGTSSFGGIKVRTYVPKGNRTSDGAIFYIHGGGFTLGNTEIFEGLMRRIAMWSELVVIAVDYRLAPETVYPGGLEDCEKALNHFMNISFLYGVDASKVVLMGDSAGGNLVASIAQRRRNNGATPELKAQVLLYPLLQFHDLQGPTFRYYYSHMEGMAFIDPISLAFYYTWYAGIDVVTSPEVALAALTNGHLSDLVHEKTSKALDRTLVPRNTSFVGGVRVDGIRPVVEANEVAMNLLESRLLDPSFAPLVETNLTALPSTLVVTCEFDILRDDGWLYAERLRRAGVPTKLMHYDNGFHAMLNFHNELFIAQESLHDVIAWVHERIDEE